MCECQKKVPGMNATYNLFLAVFHARNKIDGFEMAEINIPAEDIHVQQLAHVFLFLVSVQVRFYRVVRLTSNNARSCRRVLPLNLERMLAISLLIRFSSSSRTRPDG